MTGEGKSCIIAMFAAVLGMQKLKVDVITSSPILARRDAEEWAAFYKIFGLRATHNTYVQVMSTSDEDIKKQECYQHDIVYGTLSNFAADILREEFQLKAIRCGRRFDAVIADEVDLLMLDQGVQFTYLSHTAVILRHLEILLSTVWSNVGLFSLARTTDGHKLYVGKPNFFASTILDSVDHECNLQQILELSESLQILQPSAINILMGSDQDLKAKEMENISIEQVISILKELEEYLLCYFEVYVLNSEGLLEALSPEYDSEMYDEVGLKCKILVVDKGLSCIVHDVDEVKEGVKQKILNHLQSSNDEQKLVLPQSLHEFAVHQLPTYIDSALKALEMTENREYLIKDGSIIPIDFRNSGVVETNKRWGGGLQQMLEMKHHLKISPMSVVTNFLSHVEMFTRYKQKGAIYGLSGTLGLDSNATKQVLKNLFEVSVCSIPTHKQRKVYESAPVIVEGTDDEWFDKISLIINEAISSTQWKKGRAVLVLCEDIKTAHNLKSHVDKKCKPKGKVILYSRSDSSEINSIKHEFSPCEIVIATNLAGRGTDIKVSKEVNHSGGLLCILTFLPSNTRVEKQAFGRTGRSGNPGSVQFVMKLSNLPSQYHGHDITEIRELRAEEEQARLDDMMSTEIKEVKLQERLFKIHCKFLSDIHQAIVKREDKSVIIDTINERWGQWLQMKTAQIGRLEEKKMCDELSKAHQEWWQDLSPFTTTILHMPITNLYHFIKFGNTLLLKQDKENAAKAFEYFSRAITLEEQYACIAYYNRALTRIIMKRNKHYVSNAISDLKEASKCLNIYTKETICTLQLVSSIKPQTNQSIDQSTVCRSGDNNSVDISAQMQVRLQILNFFKKNVDEAVTKAEHLKKENEDIEACPLGVFSLIPDADNITNKELCSLWSLGLEVVYSIKKKPRFCWEGLVVCLLGVAQIALGTLITVFSAGSASSLGMGLITEGISDCIDGIVGMAKGEWSWMEWGISKATGLAISLVSGGISRLAAKGVRGSIQGAKQFFKEVKSFPKLVRQGWGTQIAKNNFRQVMKHVGKEIAVQTVMTGVNMVENKIFERLIAKLGEKIEENIKIAMHREFCEGKTGKFIDDVFIQKLPRCYVSQKQMSPGLHKEAKDLFTELGESVVIFLVSTDSEVKHRLTAASLSLFKELSEKDKSRSGVYKFIETGVMAGVVTKTISDVKYMITKFVPALNCKCQDFLREHKELTTDHPYSPHDEIWRLKFVHDVKTELAEDVAKIFSDAISAYLLQNLGSVVMHGLNRTVNKMGAKYLSDKVLKSDRTREKIAAGQDQNFLSRMDLTHSKDVDVQMIKKYADRVSDRDNPASMLEVKALGEYYRKNVTVYCKKGSQLQCHTSFHPQSGKKGHGDDIKLLYTPSPDGVSPGHYDVIIKGKIRSITSDASNCLFHAVAAGLNPHALHSSLKQQADELRHNAAEHIRKNPHIWHEHVLRRMKLDLVRKGGHYAMLGAGIRNHKTRVVRKTYKDDVKGNCRYTNYTQENGVKCRAVRRYHKPIRLGKVKRGGRPILTKAKMASMEVSMSGLNFEKNVGRCLHTLPVTGMFKHLNNVSYHIGPSEAGGNAGNPFANAVMTSRQYNVLERTIWSKEVRKWIGNKDFKMDTYITFGPLKPRNIKMFIREMNRERSADKQFHESNDKALGEYFDKIQKKEPRAQRVESMLITLTNHKGERKQISGGTDYELFIPARFCTANQQPVKRGCDIAIAVKKVDKEYVGQLPVLRTTRNMLHVQAKKSQQKRGGRQIQAKGGKKVIKK